MNKIARQLHSGRTIYTLKNKGASKGSSSDAIEEHSVKGSLKKTSLSYLFIIWKGGEVVCGQVWWPILGICALHLTHPSAHTQ